MNYEYEYEFDLTRQDYIEFNIFHIFNSKSNLRTMWFVRISTLLLCLVIPFIFRIIVPSQTAFLITLVVLSALGIIEFINFPKQYKKRLSKSVNKMLDEGNNDNFLGTRTLTLSDQGIVKVIKDGTTTNLWSSVERLAVTDNYIFIYVSSIMAYIIPSRIFSDTSDKQTFINLVEKNINPAKKPNY